MKSFRSPFNCWNVIALLKKYWMLLSLALVAGGGYLWPDAGEFLSRHEVLAVGIIWSFLLTGLTLETRVIVDALGALRLDRETLVAFTIHAPQKTLAVSSLVWSGSFATLFPGAFVPAIVCHLLQMISGTHIAQYFRITIPGHRGGPGQYERRRWQCS